MKSFEYKLKDPMGLHARPAGLLVKESRKYKSVITVIKGEKSVESNRLMALMSMGCKGGDTVTVTVNGEDEDTALAEIKLFFEMNL